MSYQISSLWKRTSFDRLKMSIDRGIPLSIKFELKNHPGKLPQHIQLFIPSQYRDKNDIL
jgi:hypothetical protein